MLQQPRQLALGQRLPLVVRAPTWWRRLCFCRRLLLLLLRCSGRWWLLATLRLLLLLCLLLPLRLLGGGLRLPLLLCRQLLLVALPLVLQLYQTLLQPARPPLHPPPRLPPLSRVPATSSGSLSSRSRRLLGRLLSLLSLCCCRASGCAVQALLQHCVACIGQKLRPQPLLLQAAGAGASCCRILILPLHICLIIAAVARCIRLQLAAAR
jgi:hypothetical protein